MSNGVADEHHNVTYNSKNNILEDITGVFTREIEMNVKNNGICFITDIIYIWKIPKKWLSSLCHTVKGEVQILDMLA